jgi:hypothetical protein
MSTRKQCPKMQIGYKYGLGWISHSSTQFFYSLLSSSFAFSPGLACSGGWFISVFSSNLCLQQGLQIITCPSGSAEIANLGVSPPQHSGFRFGRPLPSQKANALRVWSKPGVRLSLFGRGSPAYIARVGAPRLRPSHSTSIRRIHFDTSS